MDVPRTWSFKFPAQLCCRCQKPVAWEDAIVCQLGHIEWPAHRDCPEDK